MSNFLYVCNDYKAFMKVGITNEENPQTRVDTFSKDYENKFDIVLALPVKTIAARDLETFFHNMMNSQINNVKFLVEQCNIVEFDGIDFGKIVKDKADGYTEVFLSNPNFIANLLVYANFFDLIDINKEQLEKIYSIESFPFKELLKQTNLSKKLSQVKNFGVQLPNETFLKNNEFTGSVNILRANNSKFFDSCNENSIYSFELEDNNIIISNNTQKLNLNNFLNSNNNKEYCFELLKIFKQLKLNSTIKDKDKLRHFSKISINVENLLKPISTQKNHKPSNFSGVLSLLESKEKEIPLIIEYLNALEDLNFLSPDYKKVVSLLKEDISKDDFIKRYPLYEKNLDNLFSNLIDINEFDLSYSDIKPLLNKVSVFVSNILKKESNQGINNDIKAIKDFSHHWTYKSLDSIDFYESIFNVSNILNPSLIIVDNYVDEKLKYHLFEEIKKNSKELDELNGFSFQNYIKEFKIKKREFENKEFIIKNKIAMDVFNIIKEPIYNYENDIKELFSLENLNEIDIDYLFKTEIEGKTLKDLYDNNLELAKENIYKKLCKILEDHDYSTDFFWFDDIVNTHGFDEYDFDEDFKITHRLKRDEHESFEMVRKLYLVKKEISPYADKIKSFFSKQQNIKNCNSNEDYLLQDFFNRSSGGKNQEEIEEILSQGINFENKVITVRSFISIMQARKNVLKARDSHNYDFSVVSCFDYIKIKNSWPLDVFMAKVRKCEDLLFKKDNELLYGEKFWGHQRSEKANSLLFIINILKSMELFPTQSLPETFIEKVNKCAYVSNVIENYFPELKKHLVIENTCIKTKVVM